MSTTYDVIVVGSGPAGACAAWSLAKAGVAVAVIEKAARCRGIKHVAAGLWDGPCKRCLWMCVTSSNKIAIQHSSIFFLPDYPSRLIDRLQSSP